MPEEVFVKIVVFFFCFSIVLSIAVSICDFFRIKSALKTFDLQRQSSRKSIEVSEQMKERFLQPFEATGYTIARLEDGRLKIIFKKPSDEDSNMFYTFDVVVKKGSFIEKAYRNLEEDYE